MSPPPPVAFGLARELARRLDLGDRTIGRNGALLQALQAVRGGVDIADEAARIELKADLDRAVKRSVQRHEW